jgi:hypothetical protein
VVFTERKREFAQRIDQIPLSASAPDYSSCIEPFSINGPLVVAGLDTVITGNIDALVDYCHTSDRIALPRDPYQPEIACNGFSLVPAGLTSIHKLHRGENDMEWLRKFPHNFIDDLFPGQVVSYKGRVRDSGLGDARVVYFHGEEKPHQISAPWLARHWR